MLAVIVAGCGSTAAGTGSSGGGSSSVPTTRDKAVKFAECMRTNGVRAFPDPDASDALTIDALNGSSVDPSSPVFKQALSACKDLEPAGFTGLKRSPALQKVALEFAQCIRENGVPDFPDPAPDGPLVDTNRIPSSGTPGGMSSLNAAMHKCGAVYAGRLGLKGR
ncbi:MAG TPA: hypothetical protein VGH92_06915 [Gaiellaceae bacterium]